jgi:putative tryptophan/tyrosine transport system substrate-binding protein
MKRVGIVMAYAQGDPNGELQAAAFRQQLRAFGWIEGTNIRCDFRYGADGPDSIRALARELLELGPNVMVGNSNLVTSILQSEVRTIPIVFVSVSDPIGSGFVKDLARPTGNITGFANFQPTMGSKWLDLLHQVTPGLQNVGMLFHLEPPNICYLRSAEAAAPAFNIDITGWPVEGSADIERALGSFCALPNNGLIVAPNVVTFANSELIVALAERHHIPAIYPFAYFARAGGLMSYGFDAVAQFQRGAEYVDKLLRGAKPTDLPVQFPTEFDVVVNLTTAKSLGIRIPESFLALADEVIE